MNRKYRQIEYSKPDEEENHDRMDMVGDCNCSNNSISSRIRSSSESDGDDEMIHEEQMRHIAKFGEPHEDLGQRKGCRSQSSYKSSLPTRS